MYTEIHLEIKEVKKIWINLNIIFLNRATLKSEFTMWKT